jgi:TetR/AcrR family transcriptional regulator
MNYNKADPAKIILDAALETIFTNKISGARMRQIARQADMSQGNLHYYFSTKDELYSALLDHLLEIFVEERQSILSESSIHPQQKLRYFFDQQIELIQRQKEVVIFFDFWIQGTADEEICQKINRMYSKWREDIELVVSEGIRKGVFSDTNVRMLPALLASIMDGASLQFLMDEKAFDLKEYFQVGYEMVLKMLSQ